MTVIDVPCLVMISWLIYCSSLGVVLGDVVVFTVSLPIEPARLAKFLCFRLEAENVFVGILVGASVVGVVDLATTDFALELDAGHAEDAKGWLIAALAGLEVWAGSLCFDLSVFAVPSTISALPCWEALGASALSALSERFDKDVCSPLFEVARRAEALGCDFGGATGGA